MIGAQPIGLYRQTRDQFSMKVANRLVLTTPKLAARRWIHLAATYDGEVARLYVDGAEVATAAEALQISFHSRAYVGFDSLDHFGNPPVNLRGTKHFAGRLDDLRIYVEALAPEQVAKLAAPKD
jgi:hypothetical protein